MNLISFERVIPNDELDLEGLLQALSDKADDMTIQIEVRAHTKREFDPTWIRNAVEEPLDEMDIQASTRLE